MHFSSDSQHLKHCRQENLSEQTHFSLWLSYALLMLIKYAVVNVLGHLVSRIQVKYMAVLFFIFVYSLKPPVLAACLIKMKKSSIL